MLYIFNPTKSDDISKGFSKENPFGKDIPFAAYRKKYT